MQKILDEKIEHKFSADLKRMRKWLAKEKLSRSAELYIETMFGVGFILLAVTALEEEEEIGQFLDYVLKMIKLEIKDRHPAFKKA